MDQARKLSLETFLENITKQIVILSQSDRNDRAVEDLLGRHAEVQAELFEMGQPPEEAA
jgi:hypothetical protein